MASNISYNSYFGYYGIGGWINASNNNNIMYSGKSSDSNTYRSRIVLNTSNMTISSSSKLVVKITVAQQSSQNYNNTVARLSTYNLTNPGDYFEDDGYTPIATITNNTISSSKFYTNSAGTSFVGSTSQSEGNVLYLIFDTKNKIEAGKTYYIYIAREGTSSSRFNAFKASEINLTYESYTACGAPTSVSASGIITPNGTFTVKWSGATAGNANPITGYNIYYRISSEGSAPTTSTSGYTGMISVDASLNSKDITVTKATRGFKIVCGVVAVGSQSGYDSNIKTGGLVSINRIPGSPTIAGLNGIIKSEDTVKITATPGSDEDKQEYKVYYNTSKSHTGQQEYTDSSNFDISPGTKITYYFWTWDGLEYSSVVSRTIEKNSKPTVSIAMSGTVLESINNDSGQSYVIAPKITAKNGENGQSSNNSYTFKLKFGEESDSLATKLEYVERTNVLSISEIRKDIGLGKYYTFSVIRNDGIEDSEEATTNTIFYTTTAPNVWIINNDSSTTKEPKDYFSKKVRVYIDKDDGYDSIALLANETEGVKNSLIFNEAEGEDKKYATCDCSELSQAQLYNFKVKMISSTGYSLTSSEVATLTKINTKDLNTILNLDWSGIVNPFTSPDAAPTFTDIFEDNWNEWGFSAKPSFTLQSFYNNNKVGTIENLEATFNDTATATLNLGGENIYNLFTQNNILDATSIKDFSTKLILTTVNAFGDIYEWTLNEKLVNFKTALEIIQNGTTPYLQFAQSTEPNSKVIIPQCLKEGVVPYITIICESYQGPPINLKIIGSSGENVFFTYEDNNIWNIQQNSVELGYKTPISYIFQAPLSAMLEQSQDLIESAIFKTTISLANTVQSNLDLITDLKVGKHINGALSITEASYIPPENGDNGSIDLKININNWGTSDIIGTKQYKIEIQYRLPNEESWRKCGYLQETSETEGGSVNLEEEEIYNKTFGYKYEFSPFMNTIFNKYDESGNKTGEYDYIRIKLVMTTEAFANTEEEAKTSKTFESIEYIVYNIKPTVAYRKNKLGINYDFANIDDKEDGVLVISEYNDLNKIYLLYAGGSRVIDIKEGIVSDFTIDCGSWDENLTS